MVARNIRKALWLKKSLCCGEGLEKTNNLLAESPLNTVCQEAVYPNELLT